MSIIPAGTKFYIPTTVKIPDDTLSAEELEIRNKISTQLTSFGILLDNATGICRTQLYTQIIIMSDKYICTVYSNDKSKLFTIVTCDDKTDYLYICK